MSINESLKKEVWGQFWGFNNKGKDMSLYQEIIKEMLAYKNCALFYTVYTSTENPQFYHPKQS